MRATIIRLMTVFLLIFYLSSCHSPINKTNFDRIKPGMSIQEVTSILGPPSSSSTLSFGQIIGTTAIWENRNGVISILFFNGQVKLKRFVEGVTTPRGAG